MYSNSVISFLPSLKLNLKCFVEISLILWLFAKSLPNVLTFILWVSAGCWKPVLSTAPRCRLSEVPGLLRVEKNWFPLFRRNREMATCTQIISFTRGCLKFSEITLRADEIHGFSCISRSCVKCGDGRGIRGGPANRQAVTAQWLPNNFTAAWEEKKTLFW